MFKLIEENISKNVHFTDEEVSQFKSFLVLKKLPKRHFLLKPGDICTFETFIVSGCIRKYYVDPQGIEVTLMLAIEDYWVGDLDSATNHTPTKIYLETVEPCTVLELSSASKEKLLVQIPKFERIFRIILQNNVAKYQDRLITILSKSATEKYLDFMDTYPKFVNRIPQIYIASFIGISPEFLSKVRKKLATQH